MSVTINGSTGITSPGITTTAVTATSIDLTTPLAIADGGTGLTSPGTAGNGLFSDGTGWTSRAQLVSGTPVTASGTTVDFTGIPSWAKRITVMINVVSTNGASVPLIQIGDSGGIENTGYDAGLTFGTQAASHYYASTVGFPLSTSGHLATWIFSGSYTLTNITSNTWVGSGTIFLGGAAVVTGAAAGTKTLSATLDRIRITTVNGTDTFDAGTINIMYE